MASPIHDASSDALAVHGAILRLANAVDNLGNGNANTNMGAVENLAKEVKEGTERIADALHEVANAIALAAGCARI